ncbi:hypothetical protein COO60DRAFT_909475 [Scenedesmus sp. NREL 46B-D3]|nr:hypothetical protein COO60DRAFT_909475 [Scenedesmus sp. NREL 46B-D3]
MSGVLASAVEAISRPFISLFENSCTGMEPELSELTQEEAGETPDRQHLFRLFVGWVPKLFTEQDLLPLFQKYGDVRDIIILKDKVSSQPRGCAFVSYATKEEAEAAIRALDKGVHLSGALCPLEVRFARSHQYVPAGQGPTDNRQLFFTRAPVITAEEQLKALFSRFGEVEEINLFRERRTALSKGCGFITMATREQAMAAMQALDEKHLLEGSVTPLAVKWADPELQVKKRRAVEDSNADNRMLFFAKVLRSANEDEVRALFARYGRVVEVNLFRAFQGAPTTKGCGLVTMGSNDEAAAAIDALDSRHTWDGLEAPMVVKWMDAALQKRRREEHLAAMRQGLVPSMSMSTDVWSGSNNSRSATSGSAAAAAAASRSGASLSQGKLLEAAAAAANSSDSAAAAAATAGPGSVGVLPAELPPVGCAPDAYKLFVGNIPKSCTEEELRPVFQAVGPVVELVVVRDKFTHESKGSAFVWYSTRADADQAVLQLNSCRVLQDRCGDQTRPLVVRRANMRKPASALMLQQQQQPHLAHASFASSLMNGGGPSAMHSGSSSQTAGFQNVSMSLSGGDLAANAAMNTAAAAAGMPSQSLSGFVEFSSMQHGVAAQQQQQQQQQQHGAVVGGPDAALHLQPLGLQVQPDYRNMYGTAGSYQLAHAGSAMDSSSSSFQQQQYFFATPAMQAAAAAASSRVCSRAKYGRVRAGSGRGNWQRTTSSSSDNRVWHGPCGADVHAAEYDADECAHPAAVQYRVPVGSRDQYCASGRGRVHPELDGCTKPR